MRPTQVLVDALRSTADKISDPEGEWDWYDMDSCNCGLLAREIWTRTKLAPPPNIGETSEELEQLAKVDPLNGGWSNAAIQIPVCQSTGVPLPDIYVTLLEAGLESPDLQEIEMVAREEYLLDHENDRKYRLDVVQWMRHKALELEQKLHVQELSANVQNQKTQAHQTVSTT